MPSTCSALGIHHKNMGSIIQPPHLLRRQVGIREGSRTQTIFDEQVWQEGVAIGCDADPEDHDKVHSHFLNG